MGTKIQRSTTMTTMWRSCLRRHLRKIPPEDRGASVLVLSVTKWFRPIIWAGTSSGTIVPAERTSNQLNLPGDGIRLSRLRSSASSAEKALPKVTLPSTSRRFIRANSAVCVASRSPSDTALLITKGSVGRVAFRHSERFWSKICPKDYKFLTRSINWFL